MGQPKVLISDSLAPTIALDATVNGKSMIAYYVGGCCALRSLHGFDGKRGLPASKPTPEEVIQGIVQSGVSGCLMVLTDVYSEGTAAFAFKQFVEANGLGNVTISPPTRNPYTGANVVGVLFGYNPATLWTWLDNHLKSKGQADGWKKPADWNSPYAHDSIHMDSYFYQMGGRVKPAQSATAIRKADTKPASAA